MRVVDARRIPVYEPLLAAREATNVLDALHAGEISGSGGRYIEEFESKFASYCGVKYGVAVSSGTAALHVACVLAGFGARDEVLVSASTNIACANAVVLAGGTVVPVDADPETWNLDAALLPSLATRRARAIMPVHLYGHPAEMDEVMAFARARGLFVIEDCCEAHGALYGDRKVGSFGDVGCFSFYANKIITMGEGGMLVTDRADLAERARLLRNLAFARPRFRHDEVGFNYRLTNLQAAIGVAQLERIEAVIAAKRRVARWYTERLSGIPGLQLPVERDYVRNVYWVYGVVVDPEYFDATRDELMERLAQRGIETRTMFCPLHLQPALLKRLAVRDAACQVAERLWEHGLYLPSGPGLTEADVDRVCEEIRLCT